MPDASHVAPLGAKFLSSAGSVLTYVSNHSFLMEYPLADLVNCDLGKQDPED